VKKYKAKGSIRNDCEGCNSAIDGWENYEMRERTIRDKNMNLSILRKGP
jgi:hypothetical protein